MLKTSSDVTPLGAVMHTILRAVRSAAAGLILGWVFCLAYFLYSGHNPMNWGLCLSMCGFTGGMFYKSRRIWKGLFTVLTLTLVWLSCDRAACVREIAYQPQLYATVERLINDGYLRPDVHGVYHLPGSLSLRTCGGVVVSTRLTDGFSALLFPSHYWGNTTSGYVLIVRWSPDKDYDLKYDRYLSIHGLGWDFGDVGGLGRSLFTILKQMSPQVFYVTAPTSSR